MYSVLERFLICDWVMFMSVKITSINPANDIGSRISCRHITDSAKTCSLTSQSVALRRWTYITRDREL